MYITVIGIAIVGYTVAKIQDRQQAQHEQKD